MAYLRDIILGINLTDIILGINCLHFSKEPEERLQCGVLSD
jgi:hypothetical protein